MPESYLTSSDMNMMADLMDEALRAGSQQIDTSANVLARLLVERFEAGTTDKESLRDVLNGPLGMSGRDDSAINRWDSEGGAIPIATK